jgi:IS605 OrfB family transposase
LHRHPPRRCLLLQTKTQKTFWHALSFDSLTVKERNGQLIGYLCVTLPKPAVKGSVLVGVDRNETNLLVAVKETGEVFFESGLKLRIWRKKHRKKVARLQRKLAECKAQHKDTRSVRRVLKRLSLRQRNFTKTYCQTIAKRFIAWVGTDAILALENLKLQQGKKGNEALNRRLHQFPHGLLLRCLRNKAEMLGIPLLLVNPAFTSQTCSRCGNLGDRQRHRFYCPHCGFTLHADLNAAFNILHRAEETMLSEPKGLGSGLKSTSPEAQPVIGMGKPSASADGS